MGCCNCGKIFAGTVYRGKVYCKECGFAARIDYEYPQPVPTTKKEITPKKEPIVERILAQNWNELVTPHDIESFIGQSALKSELRTMVAATKLHAIQVQHCLFSGSFGLGKTTIAKIFAEMIGSWTLVNASSLLSADDLPDTNVVIIDEIHTLKEEEWLLGVMDSGTQTILGATTTAGSLSGPLRSRFVSLVLQPYTVVDLKHIVSTAAKGMGYDCPSYVAQAVAQRGKHTARVALFLFKRLYDRITLSAEEITPKMVRHWFKDMEINHDGLDNQDLAYINCLSDKPIGLQALTAMTGMDRITLEETVEPYLMGRGYVQRTPRGRITGNKKAVEVWK